MNVRLAIIDYARLRGLVPAKRVSRGRLMRVCGITFWK